jgi:hypothetical protein
MQNKCDIMGADGVTEGSNDDYRHLIQVKWAEIGFTPYQGMGIEFFETSLNYI